MDTRVRGFTLIELLMAVAVTALLATIARPSRDDLVRGGNGGFLGSAMDF